MPSEHRNRRPLHVALFVGVGVVVGIVLGVLLPQDGVREVVAGWLSAPELASAPHNDAVFTPGTLEITSSAQDALGLTQGKVTPAGFTSVVRVPAFVRERPATSNLQAASRLHGSVTKIYVDVGQTVREGDPLIELELTGDELASAQSTLLDSIKQLEIIDSDMPRLELAARSGGPSVKTLRERKFERRRLAALVDVKQQELLVRGLSEAQVKRIVDAGELVRTVIVRVPSGIRPTNDSTRPDTEAAVVSDATEDASDDWVYSIEGLHVSPGSIVIEGEPLCDLAYHATLLVEGQAYERDLPILAKLIEQGTTVTAELGDDDAPLLIPDLQILFMDNHVDNESQTYRFYTEIANRVVTDNQTNTGRRFRTWWLKPGQRGHIQLPAKHFDAKFILPRAAVTRDGLDHVVFRWLDDHNPWHTGEPAYSEYERVVVKVLYQDRQTVVVDTTGKLQADDTIAMSHAYMLLLALQRSGERTGHSHHGHEH